MGGTKGPVNLVWVMNGWSLACCGDHLSKGLIVRRPRTKSMNAIRLFISRSISIGFMFFRGMGYDLMISGKVSA